VKKNGFNGLKIKGDEVSGDAEKINSIKKKKVQKKKG